MDFSNFSLLVSRKTTFFFINEKLVINADATLQNMIYEAELNSPNEEVVENTLPLNSHLQSYQHIHDIEAD